MISTFRTTDDRILGLAIREKRVATISGVLEDRVNRIERMKQVNALVLHNATASA
ncbi:MAG: hypothetical protein ACLP0J_05585 [Solirubrobacteraceae bacterium]|jgi:hypothetical protein